MSATVKLLLWKITGEKRVGKDKPVMRASFSDFKSTTLDDTERPLRTLYHNSASFGAHQEKIAASCDLFVVARLFKLN